MVAPALLEVGHRPVEGAMTPHYRPCRPSHGRWPGPRRALLPGHHARVLGGLASCPLGAGFYTSSFGGGGTYAVCAFSSGPIRFQFQPSFNFHVYPYTLYARMRIPVRTMQSTLCPAASSPRPLCLGSNPRAASIWLRLWIIRLSCHLPWRMEGPHLQRY
jgi:hypothetical protein